MTDTPAELAESHDVTFRSDDISLAGTLHLPAPDQRDPGQPLPGLP